jgi:hypothetical protein
LPSLDGQISAGAVKSENGWRRDNLLPCSLVRHETHEYVIGTVHTNTIEGFWSIIKRGVVGTFHKVSKKYMPLYVAEFQFCHNDRENADIFGAAIARC